MTTADPHGQWVDNIRNCYSSYMRVPEYPDPIRVRWYRVDDSAPELPGSTDYCSSNWDEDRTFDPPLGEQSTTRVPFTDWRDCSPPPWAQCLFCPQGSRFKYYLDCTTFGNGTCDCGPLAMIVRLNYVTGCIWQSDLIPFCGNPVPVSFRMTISASMITVVLQRLPATLLASWSHAKPANCSKMPVTLLRDTTSGACNFPPAIQLVAGPV